MIQQYHTSVNKSVTVPSITDLLNGTDIGEVDVTFTTEPGTEFGIALGDGVLAVPQAALPTNCRLLNAYVTAANTVRCVFCTNGGNVTGAAVNFKFIFFDLTTA